MRSEWFNNKIGNPYVNYIVGVRLRGKGLDLSIDEVEDISISNKFDYSNPIYRKVKQTLKVVKSNTFKPETIFDIEYLQSKETTNKSGKRIRQWTNTQVNKIDVLLPKANLDDFLV